MAGTKAGGLKAAQTNKDKYGKDFYARIGAIGGKLGHTGASMPIVSLLDEQGFWAGERAVNPAKLNSLI